MKKRIVSMMLAMTMVGLCGCGSESTSVSTATAEAEPTASQVSEVEPSAPQNLEDEAQSATASNQEVSSEVSEGHSKLTNISHVIDQLSSQDTSNNIILSDTSLNMALALLLEGATGDAYDELGKYLGNDIDVIREYDQQLMKAYEKDENVELHLANSIWTDKTISLSSEYKKAVEKYYQSTADTLDFQNEKSVDKINNWCDQQTKGLIKDIIDYPTLSKAKNVLLNALYFKGDWENPFEEWQVSDGEFKNIDQSTKTVKMMTDTVSTYYENDNATGFAKYYKGGEIAFIGILPKQDGDFTMTDLDIASLLDSKTEEYDVDIKLPKFTLEDKYNLTECLKNEGLESIFTDGNFGKMSDADLYVDSIFQKTYVEVNEIGTKAAAITEVIMLESCMIEEPKEIKEVNLDRPFAFMIYDTENEECLFLGKVVNMTLDKTK